MTTQTTTTIVIAVVVVFVIDDIFAVLDNLLFLLIPGTYLCQNQVSYSIVIDLVVNVVVVDPRKLQLEFGQDWASKY